MTSKNQLQSKIQELEAELQEFKEQLNTYKEITIETASVGDVLEDGSIVLQKSNGLALLVAP
jgi:cell shape-determining protein MreC